MALLEKETKRHNCLGLPTVFLLQVLVSFINITLPDKLALLDIHSPASSNISHNYEDQLEYENMPYLFFI